MNNKTKKNDDDEFKVNSKMEKIINNSIGIKNDKLSYDKMRYLIRDLKAENEDLKQQIEDQKIQISELTDSQFCCKVCSKISQKEIGEKRKRKEKDSQRIDYSKK